MCGFVGFVDENRTQDKKEIIKSMNDKIVHRGPDSEGYYIDDKIALGFRRLNISGLDLEKNDQPVYNEDGNLVISFDGEIYNYEELRAELEQKGHIFSTSVNSEVILHGYEEYGEKIASLLRGMFSFVIYNKVANELYGARDNFGVKPFYYYLDKNKPFIFGSEIKSFLPHPDFTKEINKDALKMYLVFQYSVLPETFFKNVYKLPQGCYFTYKNSQFNICRYFEVNYSEEDKPFEQYVKIIDETVRNSVKRQIAGDFEIGSFLSGGVDSSFITSVSMPSKTFSVGFSVDGFDESMYAKELSDILKINNYKKIVSSDEFFEVLPKVQYYSDEPHANLSAVPLYFLSKMAAESIKVVLSGEGPDELFAGYATYEKTTALNFYRKIPFAIRKIIGNTANKIPQFKGKTMLVREGIKVEDSYIGQAFIMTDNEADDILAGEYKNSMTYKDITAPYFEKVKDKSDMIKKMYLDVHLWLPNDIFLKADKMTMANSIEVRVPFVDKEVFDIASKIPEKYFVKGKTTKYIFREVAHKTIPSEWAKRKKVGFPVPFTLWLKEERYSKILKEMFSEDFVSQFFIKEKLVALLDEHFKGIKNNGRKLYTIYSFLLWYKIYFLTP